MFAIPCGLDMWYYRLGCKKQTREASYPPRCGLVYLSGFHFSSRSKALYNDFAGNEKLSNAWVQNKFQSKSEFNWEGQQEQHYLDVEAFSVSFCGSHCCNEWLTTLLCSFSGTRAWQHSDVTCSRMVEVLTSWESSPSRKKTKHEASIGLGAAYGSRLSSTNNVLHLWAVKRTGKKSFHICEIQCTDWKLEAS